MGKLSVKLGRQGEERAVRFLQQLGYQILQRNFRGGGGELDIVKGGVYIRRLRLGFIRSWAGRRLAAFCCWQ